MQRLRTDNFAKKIRDTFSGGKNDISGAKPQFKNLLFATKISRNYKV